MKKVNKMIKREYSSFRDPSGFVFWDNDTLYRQINPLYTKQFTHLIESGLYDVLSLQNLLINHTLISKEQSDNSVIIKPECVSFISYPYEWSFNQLKDAALTTLLIHKYALEYGMVLKDASAYNIQFVKGHPKLIDTLSFDFYEEGSPWVAYGQFCRHFLAPLFLMSEVDVRLSQMMRIYIDGIPLDLASKLLKGKGGFNAKQHIHWHANSIRNHSEDGKKVNIHKKINISKFNHIAMIDSLIRTVNKMTLRKVKTEWMDYYNHTNYTDIAIINKENIISNFIRSIHPVSIWDLGANDGHFSRIAIDNGVSYVVSFDIDPIAVDYNYKLVKANKENILPLIIDLINPSPGIGFANKERNTIDKRQKPDCILALALIHHLAISNNLQFDKIAEWFAELSDSLIIEFVPKEDSQVQILLSTRDDIFINYSKSDFERAFEIYFNLIKSEDIKESDRVLYWYRKKDKLYV
jgi:hypothetical protein